MKNAFVKFAVPALLLPSCLSCGSKGNYQIFRLKEKEGASISSTFADYVNAHERLSEGKDSIYNATPATFPSSLDAELYRVEDLKETYLVHKKKVYLLGEGYAGQGAYEFALADYAGSYRLYFVYSYVRGLFTTSLGVYDFSFSSFRTIEYPSDKEFNGSVNQREMQFVLSEKNTLDLYQSQLNFEEEGELVPDVMVQEDLGSLKLRAYDQTPLEPMKDDFVARFDYGIHVKEKATLLWSSILPFFDPWNYGQSYLIAGDVINVKFHGEMIFLQSYPAQVVGNYYLVDVSFDLATIKEITVGEAKEMTLIDALGFYSDRVVNEDLSMLSLEDLSEEDVVYATFSKKNPDLISGLYSYKPR